MLEKRRELTTADYYLARFSRWLAKGAVSGPSILDRIYAAPNKAEAQKIVDSLPRREESAKTRRRWEVAIAAKAA